MKNLGTMMMACIFTCLLQAQNVGIGINTPEARLHISGADNNGTTATLKITSGVQHLLLDGNEIDAMDAGGLYLQNNFSTNVSIANGGGKLGIRTGAPAADVHLLQSDGLMAGAGGMAFDANNKIWKIYNSFSHFSFAEDGVRRAYVEAGSGDWTQPSDGRLKEDIVVMENVLDAVLQLRPARYRYIHTQQPTIGFIAQEVQQVFPGIVHHAEDGTLTLAYKDFGIIAIKAIQEQQALIEAQQQQIFLLTERLINLEISVL